MTSSRPYLVRAMYQWIVDNGMTPHLLVNAELDECIVPVAHISEGKIILNIAPMAVQGLTLGDEEVTFNARFNGKAESILVPVTAILAVYARENGQGMMFSDDDQSGHADGKRADDRGEKNADKSRVLLKRSPRSSADQNAELHGDKSGPRLHRSSATVDDGSDPDPDKPRPNLRVIK